MDDSKTTIAELKAIIEKFINDRDWKQFHTPSNLAKTITIEAAELLEIFQWVDGEESKKILEEKRDAVEQEVADIAANLLNLCNTYNIDLTKALEAKIKINIEKYPIEKCKGKSGKYTNYA